MGQQNQGRIAEWKPRTSGSSPLKEKLSQDCSEVRRPMKHAMKAWNEQAWQDLFWQDLGRKPKADRTCQKEPNASQKQEGTIEKKTQKIINPSLGLTGGVHTGGWRPWSLCGCLKKQPRWVPIPILDILQKKKLAGKCRYSYWNRKRLKD